MLLEFFDSVIRVKKYEDLFHVPEALMCKSRGRYRNCDLQAGKKKNGKYTLLNEFDFKLFIHYFPFRFKLESFPLRAFSVLLLPLARTTLIFQLIVMTQFRCRRRRCCCCLTPVRLRSPIEIEKVSGNLIFFDSLNAYSPRF